jgi:hypothetical protein
MSTTSPSTQRILLAALLDAHPGPLSRSELATLLDDRVAAEDAVDRLRVDGVANVEGNLVFASRAAVRADQLGI